jgi:hypothetical protein
MDAANDGHIHQPERMDWLHWLGLGCQVAAGVFLVVAYFAGWLRT